MSNQDLLELTTLKKVVLVLRRPELLDLTCAGLFHHALAIAFGDTEASDPTFPGVSEEERLWQALVEEGQEGDIGEELRLLTSMILVEARTPAGTSLDKADHPTLITGLDTADLNAIYNWAMTGLDSRFKFFAAHQSAKILVATAKHFNQWPSDLLSQPAELAL
ncbi:MAG TPA: hypothetical protein PLS70_22825, partial [Acidobacteriota bacterium]|nr:hypothetical protein [Acidobacteriota bacterium]